MVPDHVAEVLRRVLAQPARAEGRGGVPALRLGDEAQCGEGVEKRADPARVGADGGGNLACGGRLRPSAEKTPSTTPAWMAPEAQ